jgi:hypothetical protein
MRHGSVRRARTGPVPAAGVVRWATVTDLEPVYLPADTPPAEAYARSDGGQPVRVLAGTGSRVAARLLNVVAFVVVAGGAGGLVLYGITAAVPRGAVAPLGVAAVVLLLAVLVWSGVGPLASWGAGFGEWLVGIRVVRVEDGLRPPGYLRALRRSTVPRREQLMLPDPRWLRDEDLRRGRKDRRAGTVVVRHQAPPGTPLPEGWEHADRRRRGLVGAAAIVAVVVLAVWYANRVYVANSGPAFTVAEFYGGTTWTSTLNGNTVTLHRAAARVLDSGSGCARAGTSTSAAGTLRDLGCQGRLRADFTTPDGTVRLTGQVLRLPTSRAADGAAGQLHVEDLVPPSAPGLARYGLLDSQNRYVVVTEAVVLRGGPVSEVEAQHALARLHAVTLSVILIDTD